MDLNGTELDHDTVVNVDYSNSSVGNKSIGNSTTDEVSQNDSVYYMTALVLSWTNAVLIISLNSAVIIAIRRYKKRSRLYFLLLNLAIADLLTGITDAVPHSIERSIGMPYFQMIWVFGDAACKIQRTVSNMPMTVSNYILAVASLDRAMVICKPMAYFRKGSCLQKCVIVCCWMFSFLVSSPYLKLVAIKEKRHMDNVYSCSIDVGVDEDRVDLWKVLIITKFVYVFAIPFIVIVVSYAILLVSIYRRRMTPHCNNKDLTPTVGTTFVFNKGLPRSKIKSIKLTCGIVSGFLLSWIVFFVFMFMHIFDGYHHPFLILVVTFYYWSSVANPIMFFIFHRRRYSKTLVNKRSFGNSRHTCLSEIQQSKRGGKGIQSY